MLNCPFLNKRLKSFAKADTDLNAYVNRVYAYLDKLKCGSVVTVDKIVKASFKNLFIECVKLFIEESNQNISFLDNEYSRFKKGEPIDYSFFNNKRD